MLPNVDAPSRQEWHLIHWVLWGTLGLALLLAATTYADYGATFDEALQAEYGELALDYFESGGEDKSCNEFRDLRFYGPLVEMLPALAYRGAEVVKYEVRHLFLGLLAAFMIPAVWLYGRRFGDPRVAAFAVIAVVTMPRLYGHWFNNSKDTSFALLVLWFMAALAATFTGSRVRWGKAVVCGVAMGLALCGRPGGFPLLLLFLLAAAGCWVVTRDPADRGGVLGDGVRLLPKLAGLVGVAWVVMVLPWPWAHQSPLLHPIEAMQVAASFQTVVQVFFDGQNYRSDSLPWYYLFQSLLISTPLTVVAFAALGLVFGVRRQLTSWRSRTARMVTLTQVWLFSVLVIFVFVRPNTYGGIRHFLFILPAVGVFAAYGAAEVLARVVHPAGRVISWGVLIAILASPAWHLSRLHPYQVAYHNSLVGGVAGASDSYWTDYYMSSYVEAIEWVNEQVRDEPERRVQVILAAGSSTAIMQWAVEYAAPNVELVSAHTVDPERSLAPADYYIGTTRYDNHLRFPLAPIAHSIGRDGAVFTVIKGRP